MKTLYDLIGTTNISAAIVGFILCCIGISINLLRGSTTRDPQSQRTPFEFSWKFLFSDNNKRLLASFMSAMLVLRFTPLFWDVNNAEWFYLYAAGIGFFFDRAYEFLASKVNFFGK